MRDFDIELEKLKKNSFVFLLVFVVLFVFCFLFKFTSDVKEKQAKARYEHKTNEAFLSSFIITFNRLKNLHNKDEIKIKGVEPSLIKPFNVRIEDDNLGAKSQLSVYQMADNLTVSTLQRQLYEKFQKLVNFPKVQSGILLYSFLDKKFKYFYEFDLLTPRVFLNGVNKIKYYGINWMSNDALSNNAKVMFYNNPDDFAVKILTYGDEVYLYRTNLQFTPYSLYENMISKAEKYHGVKFFTSSDMLAVPVIKPPARNNYFFLDDKEIENSNKMKISKAFWDFEIKLSSCGLNCTTNAKLKPLNSSDFDNYKCDRDFNFNKPFVLFLKEKKALKPYYILFVDNDNILEKY